MPQYSVNHRYTSYRDGRQFGPYEPGSTVELEQADAEWVNRDSPGTLAELAAERPAERQAAVVPNRQHKGGRNRAGA